MTVVSVLVVAALVVIPCCLIVLARRMFRAVGPVRSAPRLPLSPFGGLPDLGPIGTLGQLSPNATIGDPTGSLYDLFER